MANLRATGREFWPTGMNVMEAVKSRDGNTRHLLLTTLSTLAGDSHVFPMPAEALRAIAEVHRTRSPTIVWVEPRFTVLIRNPGDVTDDQVSAVRDHLIQQETGFDDVHERARDELLPQLRELGGRDRWPNVRAFLDEVWNTQGHLGELVIRIWKQWGFPGPVPVDDLLADRSWMLFFEGWGAAVYARLLAHPQPQKVERADLAQLVYCGTARSTVFVSDEDGFRGLANMVVRGRYPQIEVVPLSAVTA